jgi:hypothetical protein
MPSASHPSTARGSSSDEDLKFEVAHAVGKCVVQKCGTRAHFADFSFYDGKLDESYRLELDSRCVPA